jgi:23S rRNA pseudouridine1911/1915/1917 synthase
MSVQLQILFEDNHLIAINKPAGFLVQGDQTGDMPLSENVKEYIKLRYDKPGEVFLGVIHRLDRPVSGVLLFARTSKALARMNELFQQREVQKTYWAVTNAQPDPLNGTLVHYLDKDREKNKVLVLDQPSRRHPDAKRSELTYEMLGRVGQQILLQVNPLTGRPHQIRAQLARIGCPIRGDLKYGFPHPNDDGNIHLHCRSLAFLHPVRKEPILIKADPPKGDVWRLFKGFEE